MNWVTWLLVALGFGFGFFVGFRLGFKDGYEFWKKGYGGTKSLDERIAEHERDCET